MYACHFVYVGKLKFSGSNELKIMTKKERKTKKKTPQKITEQLRESISEQKLFY